MPQAIGIAELRELQRHEYGVQVVEVLPDEEYQWAHIPGALHLPLKHLDGYSVADLDQSRPVVAYCNDFL